MKQDRQCTYNMTLWCICAAIVAVEKAISIHILGVCF